MASDIGSLFDVNKNIKQSYDKGLKKVNDGITASTLWFLRGIWWLIRAIIAVVVIVAVLAILASLLRSCNLDHPN